MAVPCTDMAKHLFLTGEKQVGKSTLIRRLLEHETRKIGGFYTVKTDLVFPECSSVHLLRIGAGEEPSEENLLFHCSCPDYEGSAHRFNRLGCAAIEASKDAEFIVMDELGPNELQAEDFQASIRQVLNGHIPVLGVLQKAENPFLKWIGEHPQVELIEVTCENREALADAFSYWCN